MKILEIESCIYCPWCFGHMRTKQSFCNHPELNYVNEVINPDWGTPLWCPLPDKEE